MWYYTTLCHAVRETTRFAVVHGDNCNSGAQACSVSVSQVVAQFRNAGAGLDPAKVQLELRAGCVTSAKYDQVACASLKTGTLQSLLTDGSVWPDFGAPEFESIEVLARYPFETGFAMFWPGAGGMSASPSILLPAVSREMVQF